MNKKFKFLVSNEKINSVAQSGIKATKKLATKSAPILKDALDISITAAQKTAKFAKYQYQTYETNRQANKIRDVLSKLIQLEEYYELEQKDVLKTIPEDWEAMENNELLSNFSEAQISEINNTLEVVSKRREKTELAASALLEDIINLQELSSDLEERDRPLVETIPNCVQEMSPIALLDHYSDEVKAELKRAIKNGEINKEKRIAKELAEKRIKFEQDYMVFEEAVLQELRKHSHRLKAMPEIYGFRDDIRSWAIKEGWSLKEIDELLLEFTTKNNGAGWEMSSMSGDNRDYVCHILHLTQKGR